MKAPPPAIFTLPKFSFAERVFTWPPWSIRNFTTSA